MRYDPSVGVQVDSPDMAQSQADLATANLEGQISQKVQGVAQSQEDIQSEQQGRAAGAEQGANFTPASSLTEAGRAYNEQGLSMAQNITSAQVMGHARDVYNGIMSSAVSPDNMTTYSNAMTSYYQGLKQTVNPQMLPAIEKSLASASMLYGSQITNRLVQYNKDQSVATSKQTYQQLSNEAGNQMHDSYLSPNPDIQQNAQEGAYSLYQQAMQAAQSYSAISGNPIAAQTLMQNTKFNFLNSSILGLQSARIQRLNNTTDPATRSVLLQQINDAPTNFLSDPQLKSVYQEVDPNANLSASNQYRIGQQLRRMAGSVNHSINAQSAQNQIDYQNLLIGAQHGQPVSADQIATLQRNDPKNAQKIQDQFDAANNANSIVQDFKNQGVVASQNWLQQANDPNFMVNIPNADNVTRQQATQLVKARLTDFVNVAKNDPYSYVNSTSEAQNYYNQMLSSIHPTNTLNGTQADNVNLQGEFTNAVTKPMYNFTNALTPSTRQSLSQYNAQMIQFQNQRGISNDKQSVMSNISAKSIVNYLGQLSDQQRLAALSQAQANYGTSWGIVQRSLLNNGLPASDLLAQTIMSSNSGTNNQQIASQMLAANDQVQQKGADFWKNLQTTYDAARYTVLTDKNVQNLVKSYASYAGVQSNQSVNAVVDGVLKLAAYRAQAQGKPWSSADVSTASQDVIGAMYQQLKNGGFWSPDSYRVPYTASTTGPDGQITTTPIDLGTLNSVKSYYTNKAPELSDVIGTNKTFETELSGAKWVNTPNGNGLMLVRSSGAPFYFKGTKNVYGFSWSTAANPSRLPADYATYASSIWRKL